MITYLIFFLIGVFACVLTYLIIYHSDKSKAKRACDVLNVIHYSFADRECIEMKRDINNNTLSSSRYQLMYTNDNATLISKPFKVYDKKKDSIIY